MSASLDRGRALEVALAAAREAGDVLLGHFGRLAGGEVGSKDVARDLVTRADVESERLVVARLRERYPDHAIEAEEETRDAARAGLRWFLDPLDGTINFVHGLPFFAVSLALYDGAEPLLAVVHAPRLAETFWAARGGGAWLGGQALRVSRAGSLAEAVLATGFPYHRAELCENNLEIFGRFFYEVRGLRRMGSAALDLAYTAAGRLDGFWELHLSPHDVAAGALLVREAGGLVTDARGGEGWLRGGAIVAAPAAIHAAICARVGR